MTFLAPLYFIALAAIAIPIAVHLFNFRRYKKVYFSNVEMLEQIQSETRRQSTLRQWLILAARILAVVCLVLTFANPIIPPKGGNIKAGGTAVSIYIDNSFSMESASNDQRLIETAKDKAREIAAFYKPTDRFQLMTNDMSGHQFHWMSRDDFLAAVDDIDISSASESIATVASRQHSFLQQSTFANREAFIISDFQQMSTDFSTMPSDSLIHTTIVPLTALEQNNIYIDTLWLDAPVYHLGSVASINVSVVNDSDEPIDKLPLSLYVNNVQRALATMDIPPHSKQNGQMTLRIDKTGVMDCRVATTDYPITFDDNYYFSINVCGRINLLAIEDGTPNTFLARLFEGDSTIAYTSQPLSKCNVSDLETIDAIILNTPRTIESGMAQSLHTFVSSGGSLAIIVGDDIDEESYNETFALFAAPRLSHKTTQRQRAATINRQHTLYKDVFSTETDDMEMPSAEHYWQLANTAATLREAVITLANGDDYVCSTPCGDGTLYIVSAPLDDAHTDFVRQALFVPTFYNMALHSVRQAPASCCTAGSTDIVLGKRYDPANSTIRLSNEDGFELIPDIRRAGGRSTLTLHNTMPRDGNYHITVDGEKSEGLSFNYPRQESYMHFTSLAELTKQAEGQHLTNYTVVQNPEKPLDTTLREQYEGRSLRRLFIILTLLMIATETALLKIPIKTSRHAKHN